MSDRGYLVTPAGSLMDLYAGQERGKTDHSVGIATIDDPSLLGVTDRDMNNLLASYVAEDWGGAIKVWDKIYSAGSVRIRVMSDETSVQTSAMDNRTLRKLQRLYDEDKLPLDVNRLHYWGAAEETVEFGAEDFLSAKYVQELKDLGY